MSDKETEWVSLETEAEVVGIADLREGDTVLYKQYRRRRLDGRRSEELYGPFTVAATGPLVLCNWEGRLFGDTFDDAGTLFLRPTVRDGRPPDVPDWLVVNAVRYAIGRTSTVSRETANWLVANWAALSDAARATIRKDLEAEFERDNLARKNHDVRDKVTVDPPFPLGWAVDRNEWEKVRALWADQPEGKPS